MREILVFEETLQFSIAVKNYYLEKKMNSYKKLCLRKTLEIFRKFITNKWKIYLGLHMSCHLLLFQNFPKKKNMPPNVSFPLLRARIS
jgi:deoxyadenosine/deoxycytidine kinase